MQEDVTLNGTVRGTNASGMRRYNARLILAAVRRLNGASKAELARLTTLSPQAVVRIVDELEEEGLLAQAGKRTGGMGQPATIYRINGARGYMVGVEIGRSRLSFALLNFDGLRKAERTVSVRFPTIEAVLAEIDTFVRESLFGLEADLDAVMGIGIAMPWFLGEWREEMHVSDRQVSDWTHEDVEGRLRAGIAWPVFFENDGNAATLAQLLCGVGQDLQNFLHVNIGTFVGGGLVLGGQVVQGRHGNAGALASVPVFVNDQSDYLLHHASLYTLGTDPTEADWQRWTEHCSDALKFAIVGANSLLDLDAVIVDGAIEHPRLDALVQSLQANLSRDLPPDFFTPEIRRGSLGESAASVGAALLPLHSSYSPNLASLFKRAAAA